MNIAVFYPQGKTAWSVTKGIVKTLLRMGHDVLDCGEVRCSHETLSERDLIIVSGPEYLWKNIKENYPNWDTVYVPKVGWLHETVCRDDYNTNPIAVDGKLPIGDIKTLTPSLYTPAAQDTKYGLKFLPFGVDTTMFYPREPRDLESTYTGSLYKKRRDFIEKYPEVRTLSAYRDCGTIEEYADAIGRSDVVLDLPSLSEQSNTRVFEVLASKTLLITPAMLFSDQLFEHGKHLFYYTGSPEAAFLEARDKSREQGKAKRIAQQGYEEVRSKHTMVHRLETILKDVGHRSLRWSGRKR